MSMGKLKKGIAAILCAALCMGLAGCGLIEPLADLGKDSVKLVKNLAGIKDPPYYTLDENLRPLDADDFDVYEDGKAILVTEEMSGCYFNEPYSEQLGEKYTGEPYDLRGRDITTKRGIRIGSTMEEVEQAYGGVGFATPDEDPEKVNVFDIPIEEVAERAKKAKKDEEVYFYTKRYITKDGQVLTTAGYHNYVRENNLVGEYVGTHKDEFLDSAWIMAFRVKNDVITAIAVSNDLINN